MKSVKKIKEEIKHVSQIKGIVEVFEELSAIDMKNIREEILGSRDFLERLATLSNDVGSDLGSLAEEQRYASVYLSSSGGMYGDLPEKVFTSFLKYVETHKSNVFIFGKQGKTFVERYKPDLKFNYYDLDEKKKTTDIIAETLKPLLNFGQITVFYGKFKNVVNQEAMSQTIMGDFADLFEKLDKKELSQKRFKYLYEPNVSEVSSLFAAEIKTSIFEGMIKENTLARTGSRLMHLDKAFEKIEENLALLEIVKNRENKKVEDKKQQERIKRLWL